MLGLTLLSGYVRNSPLCKGGLGGIWERLKIPLNPPLPNGDLQPSSRRLLTTAAFFPYSSLFSNNHSRPFTPQHTVSSVCQDQSLTGESEGGGGGDYRHG